MLGEQIRAVYEDGIFRPLDPVKLPEHQFVTLLLSAVDEEFDEEVALEPLPLQNCKTIRVRIKQIGNFKPVPYPIEAIEPEQE